MTTSNNDVKPTPYEPPEPTILSKIGPIDLFRMFRGRFFKPTVIILYATFALSFWKYIPPAPIPSDGPFRAKAAGIVVTESTAVQDRDALRLPQSPSPLTKRDFFLGERKIIAAFFLMGLIPAGIVRFVFREKLSDYGLTFGNRFTIRSALILTPVLAVFGFLAAKNELFYFNYPLNPTLSGIDGRFWLHAIFYAVGYYLSWEFLFRGFLLRGLSDSYGLYGALLIQTLASTMVHYGHPLSEVLGSVGGGLFWGLLALRTHSILSGWLQHSTLGVFLDYFLLIGRP